MLSDESRIGYNLNMDIRKLSDINIGKHVNTSLRISLAKLSYLELRHRRCNEEMKTELSKA